MEIALRAPALPPPPSARPPRLGVTPGEVAGLHDELLAYHRAFAALFHREEQRRQCDPGESGMTELRKAEREQQTRRRRKPERQQADRSLDRAKVLRMSQVLLRQDDGPATDFAKATSSPPKSQQARTRRRRKPGSVAEWTSENPLRRMFGGLRPPR